MIVLALLVYIFKKQANFFFFFKCSLEKTLESLVVQRTTRGSNKLILKEISPEYSLKGLMMKLKLQYFGHLMGSTDSLEKIQILGKVEGRRTRE